MSHHARPALPTHMLRTLKDLFDSLLPPAPQADPQTADHLHVAHQRALRDAAEDSQVEHKWRVADLLHVPHGAYVHARMRAQQAAGAV